METSLVDVLFEYDAWANRKLLQTCCQLSHEEFVRPLGLGHGNLENTLAHLVGAVLFFTDRLNRTPPRSCPDRDGRIRTASELLDLFEKCNLEFLAAVRMVTKSESLTEPLSWTDVDEMLTDPSDQVSYAVALAQMIDHSIHHRTQALDMLALLGVPQSTEWHPFEWDESVRNLG